MESLCLGIKSRRKSSGFVDGKRLNVVQFWKVERPKICKGKRLKFTIQQLQFKHFSLNLLANMGKGWG